jgi:transcriptional regulator with XRE-family HTH domain
MSDVGERLRATRLRRRMTLKQVAGRAELSESFLSQLERGRVNASIGSLQRIAVVLGTTLAEVFGPRESGDVQVVRSDDRPRLEFGVLGHKLLLTPTPTPLRFLEVFVGRFDIGGSTGDPYSHGDNDEMFIVLGGRFSVAVGTQWFELEEGDCLNYRSSLPHRAINVGDDVGTAMWVIRTSGDDDAAPQ